MRAVVTLIAVGLAAGSWLAIRHRPQEASAEPVIATGRAYEIASVSLDGRNLPTAALRDALATRAGSPLDVATLKRDRVALVDTLADRGHLTAQVGEPRVTFGPAGAVYVTFPVEPGPLFRIRSVRVAGAKASEAGVLTLGVGEVADGSGIALARRSLEQRLRVRGRSQGSVAVETELVLGDGVVDVVLGAR